MNPPRPPSQFVTLMAWISLGMAVMGVASGLLQAVMLPLMPMGNLLQPLQQAGTKLPSALAWLFEHLQLLNFLSLLSSALFAWVSWGLLKRREWGRLGFIAFLALGALAGLAGAVWFNGFMAQLAGGVDTADIDPILAQMQTAMRLLMWLAAGAIVLLHAAIIWKLCTPAIRGEFRR